MMMMMMMMMTRQECQQVQGGGTCDTLTMPSSSHLAVFQSLVMTVVTVDLITTAEGSNMQGMT
jgi:hypothetical protein